MAGLFKIIINAPASIPVGIDYHFVSLEEMSSDIEKGRFLEVGQYKGHFYGTSYDSVRTVAARGKICLVDTSAEAISTMLKADMHPVVVFLRPSSMKALADQLPHLPADRIGELYMQAEKVGA